LQRSEKSDQKPTTTSRGIVEQVDIPFMDANTTQLITSDAESANDEETGEPRLPQTSVEVRVSTLCSGVANTSAQPESTPSAECDVIQKPRKKGSKLSRISASVNQWFKGSFWDPPQSTRRQSRPPSKWWVASPASVRSKRNRQSKTKLMMKVLSHLRQTLMTVPDGRE
jgi:hypothetical protein